MDANRGVLEEKDEKIAQLERQLSELKEAYQQSAATIAAEHNTRTLSPPKGLFKSFLNAGRLKIILAILVLAITIGGIWLFVGSNFKHESATFVENVQELSTLATAKAYIKAVIHEEDNKIFGKDISKNLPGTKRELLFVVPGTVIAGVDLKRVTSEDMAMNEKTKEIDITLPHAEFIEDPALQMDKRIIIVNGGLFRGDIERDEAFNLTARAQEQIRQDADSIGLLATAEENAEKALKEFFKNMGYSINVTFK